jgi:Spy/CpxP family protein refolding chaperone
VIKRISLLVGTALLAVMMLVATAAPAFAAPPPCEPGAPGCKTVEGKNDNFTQSQRGNLDAPGTESTQTCGGTGSGKCPPGQF